MSTLRNIAAHLWRGSNVRKANLILGVTGAALTAACAAEQAVAPVAPSGPNAARAAQGASATRTADPSAGFFASKGDNGKGGGKHKDDYSQAELDSLASSPAAYQSAVQPGGTALFLTCKPKHTTSTKRVIGPAGGTLSLGENTFVVPAGALDSAVKITVTAPQSTHAELEFAPHGLHFNKPVEMTLSYKGCVVPDSASLGVAYVGGTFVPIAKERMPSHHDKASASVSALTDHFSGYYISWARR
jgi:hypothetical protein